MDKYQCLPLVTQKFVDSKTRWEKLLSAGATDEQIKSQIKNEFYLGGGSSVPPDGFVNYSSGGSNLWVEYFLWSARNDAIKISGAKLVNIVREAFDIPRPGGQLRMF